MAAAQFFGVAGVARKVKSQFMGVAGVARKIKNAYVGVGGVARKCYAGLDIKPTLADNDWATIAAVSEMGMASTYWSVGDTKDITLSTGETLTLVIMGFDHDDLQSGGKAGITFGLRHLMKDTRYMHSGNTNAGGFTGSELYAWLQDTLLHALPSDLQAVIKTANKKTSAGNQSATISTNAMKLFLFSEQEFFGAKFASTGGEGTQYSYFETEANRIKKLQNGAGAACAWWSRSPVSNNSYRYVIAHKEGGSPSSQSARVSQGVCFGFCV